MRVLHYVSGLSPTIGGIEKFILNLYEAQKDNIEITILTRYYDENTVMAKMFRDAGIRLISLDIHHLNVKTMVAFSKKLDDFFKQNAGEFDVLHNSGIEDPYVSAKARKYGIPKIIIHVHSYSELGLNIPDMIKRVAMFRNCVNSNYYLACSREVADATYAKRFLKRLQVMNNGIDTKKYDFNERTRKEYRRQLNVENDFVIGTVGRMEDVKNHAFLIDIFNEILKIRKNSSLLLVGSGRLRADLVAKCKDLGISNQVIFLGEREDVDNILQACDVFVMPSKKEGLGIAAIEAQASGLKTFVSSNVVPKSINCTGLVTFLDLNLSARKWAESIVAEGSNYDRESQVSKIGHTNYDNRFSSDELMKIYRCDI